MNNPNFPNMMPNNGMRPQMQMQQIALNHYRGQQPPPGWQQACSPDERARTANQISVYYRLLKPDASDQEVIAWGIRTETERFMQSSSKEEYHTTLKQRFVQLQQARQRNVDMLQQGNNMGQQMMMGQGNLQIPRSNQGPQMPQGFPNPQLQRPMQASPIPMNPSQSSMGNENPNQFSQQQPAPQPNMQRGPQQQQGNMENNAISAMAQKLQQEASPEVKENCRRAVMQMSPDKRQALAARGIDPLFFVFRQHAAMIYQKNKANGIVPGSQGNMQGARPMQPGQSTQMPGQQVPTSQGQLGALNGQEFDYALLAGQQAEALRVQDQGQLVVPASNNPNATPSMGAFGPNGASQAGQVSQPNQNQNGMAQRQAFVNAQAQAQAQAQNHVRNAQAQAQAQARAQQQAQAQAQQAAQAQQHAQAQQQAQSQAAQQQAQGQMMLRGQVGGLNMPQGARQSPAMPFLTRPMVPPGQQGNPTPQQGPQAHIPHMNPQTQNGLDPRVAAQVLQQAQERAAAAQGTSLSQQQRAALVPANIPGQAKAHLMALPDDQFRAVLSKINGQRSNTAQNPAFPGNVPQMGQNGLPMNSNSQAFAMGLQNQQFPNAANLNAQQQMRLAQQNPSAMTAQQIQMLQQHKQQQQQQQQNQRVHAATLALRQNPQIINETDSKPFPQNLLNTTIKQHIPPDVKTWAQLKEWANRNPNLAPNFEPQKLVMLQVMHYLDSKQQQQRLNGQGPPQPNNGAAMATPQPGGPAPLARMVSHGGQQPPMQARIAQQMMPGMASIQPPTQQELQFYRQKLNPAQSGVSDDQLRQYILQQRMAQAQKMHALQQQQMSAGQPTQPPMQPQPQQTPRPPMPPSQPSGSRPPNRAPQPPKPAAQPQNGNKQGVKRAHDEIIDVSNPGITTPMPAPQAPAMVPSRSQQGVLNLTPEQMRAQQIQKAQAQAQVNRAVQPPNGAQVSAGTQGNNLQSDQRFRQMLAEVDQTLPREAPKALSPDDRAQMAQWIKEHLPHIRKMDTCIKFFMAMTGGADNKRITLGLMEARIKIWRQLTKEGGLADQVTITKEELQRHLLQMTSFISKVAPRIAQAAVAKQQSSGSQQPQQQALEAPQSKQAQLNAANLKIVEQQANIQRQQHSLKAPPPPTTDRPPFQLGAQSPRGAPQYLNESRIDPNNLKIPSKKKQKLDLVASQTSTPGPTSSPQVGGNKGASPDLKRQQQPEKPSETKPTFRCRESSCDFSVRGFDTQAELEAHVKDAHPRIDDPLLFALESLRDSLGLDKDGKEKVPKVTARATNRGVPPAGRNLPQAAKSGQTPATKQEVNTPVGVQSAATPMARVATQTSAMRGSPSTNLLRTPQTGAKVATPGTGHGARGTPANSKLDPKEALKPTEREKTPDPWSSVSFDPATLRALVDSMDIPGMRAEAPKLEDTSWIPRSLETLETSPATTPASSKDSTSTRDSDISEMDNLQINVGGDSFDPEIYGMSDTMPELDIYEELRMLGVLDDGINDLGMNADGKMELPTLSWENTFGKIQEVEGGVDGWGAFRMS